MHVHVHLPFVHHSTCRTRTPATRTAASAPINFATLMAFLAWFGGTGYLLTSQFRWLAVPALGRWRRWSACVGAVDRVLGDGARAVVAATRTCRAPTTRWSACSAASASRFAQGGTGELIYSHGGTRQSCGARSADGRAIEQGAEVVVTAYDRGIAYVRRWDDLAAGRQSQGGGAYEASNR